VPNPHNQFLLLTINTRLLITQSKMWFITNGPQTTNEPETHLECLCAGHALEQRYRRRDSGTLRRSIPGPRGEQHPQLSDMGLLQPYVGAMFTVDGITDFE
jgi:hypothetical protein